MKKQFLILFAFISVLALSQVPQRFNKVIVTGDITSPKFIKTGSNADSVLLGNGSARAISTIKTDTVSLSNRINAKAAGNGTANGTNTGDETLTSIKTKLGAATSVSDGYLKYQDFALLHTPTTVTASNGLSISGQNIALQDASLTQSGALTFNDYNKFNSKEPAITKNSGFNLPLGNTPGTVLEGRTFGTAANSAVGDFQPIENQRLSTTNSPSFNRLTSTVATGTAPLTVNSTTVVSNLNSDLLRGHSPEVFHRHLGYMSSNQDFNTIGIGISENIGSSSNNSPAGAYGTLNTLSTDSYYGWQTYMDYTGQLFNRSKATSGWQTWRKIYDSGNLTNNLSTNYIPKWNGSMMVNSLISDDGNVVLVRGNSGSPAIIEFNNAQVLGKRYKFIGQIDGISNTGFALKDITSGVNSWYVDVNNNFTIPSTTPSTSPTTGALVVGGGIGADHVRANNFYGNGSNLTGVQLPITLTTNGTSGAATFENGVMNVPNYAESGGVNQTQTTVNGSTSGTMVCSMPFQTSSYKKAIIQINSLAGTATYTFPSAFTLTTPGLFESSLYSGNRAYTPTSTSITVTCSSGSFTGFITIEGY